MGNNLNVILSIIKINIHYNKYVISHSKKIIKLNIILWIYQALHSGKISNIKYIYCKNKTNNT